MTHALEWFVLHRDDRPYASRPDRKPLEEMVLKNPDFTEPVHGKLPTWEIVRYVPEPPALRLESTGANRFKLIRTN